MMSLFSDLIEDCMEVFMDDFSVYGDSFSLCLDSLVRVLDRCVSSNLVLNFEKMSLYGKTRYCSRTCCL